MAPTPPNGPLNISNLLVESLPLLNPPFATASWASDGAARRSPAASNASGSPGRRQGLDPARYAARNAANDTSRPIVPPSEEGGLRQRGYSSAELRDGGGGGGGDGGEACNAGSSAELRDGGGGGDGGEACDAGGAGGELHGAPTATTPASRLVDDCMTEDGSSIICAGATLEAVSLLVVRSAGCTKAEAPAMRDSAKTERSIV